MRKSPAPHTQNSPEAEQWVGTPIVREMSYICQFQALPGDPSFHGQWCQKQFANCRSLGHLPRTENHCLELVTHCWIVCIYMLVNRFIHIHAYMHMAVLQVCSACVPWEKYLSLNTGEILRAEAASLPLSCTILQQHPCALWHDYLI